MVDTDSVETLVFRHSSGEAECIEGELSRNLNRGDEVFLNSKTMALLKSSIGDRFRASCERQSVKSAVGRCWFRIDPDELTDQ